MRSGLFALALAATFFNSLSLLASTETPDLSDFGQSLTRSGEQEEHIRELLGSRLYTKMAALHEPGALPGLKSMIYLLTQGFLKASWKGSALRITEAILAEAKQHGFDPVFLVAVIHNESVFDPHARGGHGEIGLMQLRPKTAKWIGEKFNIPYHGTRSLKDPVANIRLGAAYLCYLRDRFDADGRLYLAAYNMGVTSVNRARKKDYWPKEYISRVMSRYLKFYAEAHADNQMRFLSSLNDAEKMMSTE